MTVEIESTDVLTNATLTLALCSVQVSAVGASWCGITSHGRTQLVIVAGNLTAIRYRDEIIRPHVLPFLQGQRGAVMLQQDNARPHVAQQNVNTLPWPAISPDLSPIEHLWNEMERRLRLLPNQPLTLFRYGTTSHKGF